MSAIKPRSEKEGVIVLGNEAQKRVRDPMQPTVLRRTQTLFHRIFGPLSEGPPRFEEWRRLLFRRVLVGESRVEAWGSEKRIEAADLLDDVGKCPEKHGPYPAREENTRDQEGKCNPRGLLYRKQDRAGRNARKKNDARDESEKRRHNETRDCQM